MATYTIASICTNIHETFEEIAEINRVFNYDEIPDSIPNMDLPLIMVYPNLISPMSGGSETQVFSFGGGSTKMAIKEFVFIADLFVKQRANFNESLIALVPLAQIVLDKVEAQPTRAPFGDEAISSFQFEGERSVINYGDADYDCVRYTISVRVF